MSNDANARTVVDINGTVLAIGDEVEVTHDTDIPVRNHNLATGGEVRGRSFTIVRNLHASDGLTDSDGELRLVPQEALAGDWHREYILPSALTKTGSPGFDDFPALPANVQAALDEAKRDLQTARQEAEQARTARDNLTAELRRLSTVEGLTRSLDRRTDAAEVVVDKGSSLGMDDDGECVVVVLQGVTLNDDGDIVPNVREYEYEATITLVVNVSGTVEARDEDEAHDLARYAADELDLRVSPSGVDGNVEHYDIDSVDIEHVYPA